jgi:hypothetical protein
MASGSPPALTILIIRHAEKAGEQWPGPGLTLEGVKDDKSLVVRGWQRPVPGPRYLAQSSVATTILSQT